MPLVSHVSSARLCTAHEARLVCHGRRRLCNHQLQLRVQGVLAHAPQPCTSSGIGSSGGSSGDSGGGSAELDAEQRHVDVLALLVFARDHHVKVPLRRRDLDFADRCHQL